MAAPSTLVRSTVKTLIQTEFAAEITGGWQVKDDKLPRASGHDGVTRIATHPIDEEERFGRVQELIVRVVIQVYLAYDAKIDEFQTVDPATIEALGDRIRRRFKDNSSGTTADMWFLRLRRIEYPDDPTGNKTRLEAEVQAHASNPAGL